MGTSLTKIMDKVGPLLKVATGTTGSNTSEQVISGSILLAGMIASTTEGEAYIRLYDGADEKVYFGTVSAAQMRRYLRVIPGRVRFDNGLAINTNLNRQLNYTIFYEEA